MFPLHYFSTFHIGTTTLLVYLFIRGGEAFLGRNKNTYCGHWNIYTGGNVSVIFIEQRGMYIGEGEICLCGVNEG